MSSARNRIPAEQLLQKAVAAHRAGAIREAERIYDRVLKANPGEPNALNLKGVILTERGRYREALVLFDRACAALPSFPEVHFNRGNALSGAGRRDEALVSYDRALALKTDYADARLNTGRILHEQRRGAEAVAAFRAMTTICPKDWRGHFNLGVCLTEALPTVMDAEQDAIADEALAALRRALALDPTSAEIHFALSNLLSHRGDYETAMVHSEKALSQRPDWSDAWNNFANHVEAVGDRAQAVAAFDRALALNPTNIGAIVNRGLAQLSLGRFSEGWTGYRRRMEDPRFPSSRKQWPWPAWQGDNLSGKSILLWGDQGIGDEILHGSMIAEIVAKSGHCVVQCAPRLVALYRRSFPKAEIVADAPEATAALLQRTFDVQSSMLDSGPWLRWSFSGFPNCPQWLRADQARSAALRRAYQEHRPGAALVGLSWRSINPHFGRQKSLKLEDFVPIIASDEFTLVNLQYGDTAQERADLVHVHAAELLHDSTIDPWTDLDGLAAQISALDLVVTVSNSTAHLAGALGVPTWLYVPDGRKRLWYWFDRGAYSPWYAPVRIYRGSLEGFMTEVNSVLAARGWY